MGRRWPTHEIRLSRTLAATPEELWRALTDSSLLAQWLMPNDLQACAGCRFTFRSQPRLGWDGEVHCEVREVQQLKRFSFSWVGNEDMPETEVTWSLEPISGGTRLTLVHSGFRGIKYALVGRLLGFGWKRMLSEDLPRVLAGAGCVRPPQE
jgi:uncharacterized protein YndB with AHSA1/START domain